MIHTRTAVPTVAIYNNLETFYRFLQRSSDKAVLEKRMYRGDRGIFWLGPEKLLIATKDVPDAKLVCDRWGYSGTRVLTPRQTTRQLSLDILHDANLLRQIVQYAGAGKTLQLIPYATTPEFYVLADHLHLKFGLNIIIPESPTEQNLWIRDYIDTKAGFRSLISQWLQDNEAILPGFICHDIKQAARATHWFNRQKLGAVVKASGGESGIGHLVFLESKLSLENISKELEGNPFLKNDLIVVDQYIKSAPQLSPSLELFVPAVGEAPRITYVSKQLFSEFGHFSGVLLSRTLLEADWYPPLAEYGIQIARHLQALGYIGHFDIDTVVDDSGHLYLLEINARRTGGTYVHEFATLTFGKDYIGNISLLCNNSVKCGDINQLEDLMENLDDLLFPIQEQDRGIVITVTSSLPMGEFGCILIAENEQELLMLQEEMLLRLANHSKKKIRVNA